MPRRHSAARAPLSAPTLWRILVLLTGLSLPAAALGSLAMGIAHASANDYLVQGPALLAIRWTRLELLRNCAIAILSAAVLAPLVTVLISRGFPSRRLVCVGALLALVPTAVSVTYAAEFRVEQSQLPWAWSLPILLLRRGMLSGLVAAMLLVWVAALLVPAHRRSELQNSALVRVLRIGGELGIALAAIALLGIQLALRATAPAPRPYPVVLISWDSTRSDHLSAYGYPHTTTPHLDAFARDAVLFERAVAQYDWTRPSYISMFTSQFQLRPREVRSGELTLAERLSERGYRTVAFVQNPQLDAQFGFAQGFDRYVQAYFPATPEAISQRVVREIRSLAGSSEPFFLFVQLLDPHWPYEGMEHCPVRSLPPGFSATGLMRQKESIARLPEAERQQVLEYLRCGYEAELGAADRALGDILSALRETGLYERALIALNSDHGDEFHEHGSFGHRQGNLHPELTFVPLVIRFPDDQAIAPRRISTIVRNLDLLPTILQVLGIETVGEIHGQALLPLERLAEEPPVAPSASGGGRVALRQGDWSVHFDAKGDGAAVVYDLATDPGEHDPIPTAIADPASAHLQELIPAWRGRLVDGESGEGQVSRDLQERLRALGYAQ